MIQHSGCIGQGQVNPLGAQTEVGPRPIRKKVEEGTSRGSGPVGSADPVGKGRATGKGYLRDDRFQPMGNVVSTRPSHPHSVSHEAAP